MFDDLPVFKVSRVMTPEEADELNGQKVTEHNANMTLAGIYVDSETDEPIYAYCPMTREQSAMLRNALLNVKMTTVIRQSTGNRSSSRTFGYAPRKVYQKREGCKVAALAWDHPEANAVLMLLAEEFAERFAHIAPDISNSDIELANNIDLDWRISPKASWTSGVINRTATLPFHRDGFNYETWSAMPVVRRGIRGGFLHFPEYDLTCETKDGWVSFFPGHKLLHGVTPIQQVQEDGYRFSCVYYSLKGMKDCFTYAIEQSEALKRRTAREEDLARGVINPDDSAFGRSRR